MKRFAIIIEASEAPGEVVLPGAKSDAKHFREWLYSKNGGDWYTKEMVVLHTPTVRDVKKAIETAGKVDFAFVTFSGHGFHSEELDQTKVLLKDGRMGVRDLIPDTDRCTMVVDACRNVMPEIFPETIQLSLGMRTKSAMVAQRNYRQDFETELAKAEKGTIFLYSCDLDESAGESDTGGYFSRYLLETGRKFVEQTDGTKWLSTYNAFGPAAAATTGRNSQQHPKYEPGRRLLHFPFAV